VECKRTKNGLNQRGHVHSIRNQALQRCEVSSTCCCESPKPVPSFSHYTSMSVILKKMPPLDFLKRLRGQGSQEKGLSSGNGESSPSTTPSNRPAIKIKHKSTMTINFTYEVDASDPKTCQFTCFPSDTVENFVKEKLASLLDLSAASSSSQVVRTFRERYALFVRGSDETSSSIHSTVGDWVFNYGLSFAELNQKGTVRVELR